MKPYFERDGITIYHGDCREIVPMLDRTFTALVGDPPYGKGENVKRDSAGRGNIGRAPIGGWNGHARDWPEIAHDKEPFDPKPWLIYPKVILWGANHYASRLPDATRWLVWDKRDGGPSDDNADCELAWTNLKGPARLHRQLWRGICRAGEENVSRTPRLHPMQKPAGLIRWCFDLAELTEFPARRDEVVLDPWTGSGVVLQIARERGLRAVGIEKIEHYCEVAARRLDQGVLELNT